jgi:hypothetical protein
MYLLVSTGFAGRFAVNRPLFFVLSSFEVFDFYKSIKKKKKKFIQIKTKTINTSNVNRFVLYVCP